MKSKINYTWIIKHFAFLMFLALLGVLYIANVHWADNILRDINRTAKQVEDLKYECRDLQSLEMYKTRESQVREAALALGLKASEVPPVKLITDTTTGN